MGIDQGQVEAEGQIKATGTNLSGPTLLKPPTLAGRAPEACFDDAA